MSKADDRAWLDYSARFRRDVLPKLLDSACLLSIGTEVGTFDVQQATELGAALCYDKPILLLVPVGRTVSARLRRAADLVVDNWDPTDDASQVALTTALDLLIAAPEQPDKEHPR